MEIAKTKTERLGFPDRLAVIFATGVGAGFGPKAPGTAGSLVGVLIYHLMEGLTLGAFSQPVEPPSSGYLAFVTLGLYLFGLALLPGMTRTALVRRAAD